MSQVESKNIIHWPSLFWFGTAIMSLSVGLYQLEPSIFLMSLGFCCMGYSCIRLLPADFFTKKSPFSVSTEKKYRRLDIFTQLAGFIFMASGLVVLYIYA